MEDNCGSEAADQVDQDAKTPAEAADQSTQKMSDEDKEEPPKDSEEATKEKDQTVIEKDATPPEVSDLSKEEEITKSEKHKKQQTDKNNREKHRDIQVNTEKANIKGSTNR